MGKLKVGVIGCGSIASRRHLIEYAANQDVEITAVCDVVASRAEEMALVYGAKAFTEYDDVLQLDEIDVISVCLPNHLHAPVSIAALNAGKHVLCEKPMATSVEEAEEMIQAARRNQKTLMIAHNQRFVASHQKAKQLIESGEIGKIYSFRTTFGHPGPERWSIDGRSSWFFNKDQALIGALGDLGVHKSDLIRYLLGEVVEVGAFVETSAKENTDVDDNAVAILKMESGVIGTLAASWSYVAGGDNSTIIYGENAILRLEDDHDHSLIVQYKNGEVVKYELDKIQTNEAGGQTTTHVIDHFVDAIKNNKAPLIPGEEGKKSLEVILAALDSNQTKKIVNLKAATIV
ncbi:Gfo/Idh/MocA family protein [Metabacillus sediminilitoris]|uniref:Gfo/Idh/MocA family oxidoreductase n=1 Tax=Metabacillus sediminilitoris TaxID=2567941 RepID=A0A4S4BU85_9BACI|nr:Gfo/Idh/MocA family oxidoreductase [Metabacillus sediminilitoris]QGQ45022.1 gfo/Idh/MocA family oxidoreductase [Metabacillus sediminilitoris]THF78654.1 Gfo/Idh/MocA family oxidoreductase [Metabacillus sediminilitoris]